jgi:predicted molibdopterin-dependent oxidoreductase YjgC
VRRREKLIEELKHKFAGVPAASILGIGSAQFTNEDNAAFKKFLQEVLGVTDFVYQAKEVENPSHDDFLISADKNPNRAGVEALGMKPLSADKRYKAFFVLGEIAPLWLEKISLDRDRKVALFASHDVPANGHADFIFPVAMWAEQEGTFTNKKGMVQKIHAAFPPPGEASPVWQWVEEIARVWK